MHEPAPTGTDEDAVLMSQLREGDRAAFTRLYDRHARSVVSFAYRFVQDRAKAEELAQEVFLKLFRSAESYEPRARFKTFLFRIAANHCLNERRRGEYRTQTSLPETEDGKQLDPAAPATEGPDEALAGKDLEGVLGKALAELPERERVAFCLARFEGMPYREIAAALNASEPAIKSLIHRATVSVARRLAPVVGADPLKSARG
ncbi:MAG: sigma-70 family RNA polymerase sigma factor [Deltaproteobacteria bacterium]|nr:sigma-70 family RNA polymerase sigma factor [Deltaproteobacteria bacterium]